MFKFIVYYLSYDKELFDASKLMIRLIKSVVKDIDLSILNL